MRLRSPLLASCLAVAGLAQAQGIGDPTFPELGNRGYLATSYIMKLDYEPSAQHLAARVLMKADATEQIKQISLDFTGFDISSVKLDGQDVKYSRVAEKLIVSLPTPLSKGTHFSLETNYSGKPAQHSSQALEGLKAGWIAYDEGSVAVCEPNLAHTWFPCNDHPRNKASFEFHIRTPQGYTAVANGLEIQRESPENHEAIWREAEPMMTCMATIAIGKFAEFDQTGPNGLPIRNFLPHDGAGGFHGALSKDTDYLKLLSDRLGPYPWSSYGTIMLPQITETVNPLMSSSALETTTIPVFGFGPGHDGSVLIHEMCHQWMGDCVSVTNWEDDIWWVEGFADFSEKLLLESEQGHAAYETTMRSTYHAASQARWLRPGHLTPETLFSGGAYTGGCLVFYALREKLGDEKFFKVVRTFIEKHKYGNASSSDWAPIASEVAGKDMKPFFDAWLYGDKIPSVESR